MKSDVIVLSNKGEGFEKAVAESRKVAVYNELSEKNALHLQLFTEEMLSMLSIVAGETTASFWICNEGPRYELHLSAKADLDRKQREQLINASTEGVNAASRSFLGFLRDSFETAMARDPEGDPVPVEVYAALAGHELADSESDGYECSVLKRLADNVAISIRGREVDLKVSKNFAG